MIFGTIQERKTTTPFQNSLSALAQVALHETGAEGYAFFLRLPRAGLARHSAFGAEIPEEFVLHAPANILVWPLGSDGLLAFALRDADHARQVQSQLDRMAHAIESVWSAAQITAHYSELASHVADLEARLLD
ncbi:MAG TPA: hypothetical protein VGM43_14370, partial [Bryobacteraceae bacterium]